MGGSLEYQEIDAIYRKYPEYRELVKTFIETGTYKGVTTRMASKHFDRVITFEIVQALYQESMIEGHRSGCRNIEYYLGDSVMLLSALMPTIVTPSFYFIDAHISGSDSYFNGKELVPLMSELGVILKYNKGKNIFVIDDARFWISNNKPLDWAHISVKSITDLFGSYNVKIKDSYLENDRYIILTE